MVMANAYGNISLVNHEGRWIYLDSYDDDLVYVNTETGCVYAITEVYGYSRFNFRALRIETDCRGLLWKREDTKKMTVEEIEEELGYRVEIIGGAK
jgi:hypothetical protein